jgi:hypothetical protein
LNDKQSLASFYWHSSVDVAVSSAIVRGGSPTASLSERRCLTKLTGEDYWKQKSASGES